MRICLASWMRGRVWKGWREVQDWRAKYILLFISPMKSLLIHLPVCRAGACKLSIPNFVNIALNLYKWSIHVKWNVLYVKNHHSEEILKWNMILSKRFWTCFNEAKKHSSFLTPLDHVSDSWIVNRLTPSFFISFLFSFFISFLISSFLPHHIYSCKLFIF